MSDRRPSSDLDSATLVSLFYEAIFAPKSWIGLSDQPVSVSSDGSSISAQSSLFEKETLDGLRPLLEQALDFEAQRSAGEVQDRVSSAALQGLPLPMVIVDKSCQIISATEAAEKVLREGDFLIRHEQGLASVSKSFSRRLSAAVRHTIETGETSALSVSLTSGNVRMVLATPLPIDGFAVTKGLAALFFNFSFHDIQELSPVLAETHGLTPTEAEVVAFLVQGLSLEEIAQEKASSINTVRTQVKQVYAKTGTSRQGELISRVMSGPGLWMHLLKTQKSSPDREVRDDTFFQDTVALKSGGCIGYGDLGPVNGYPVLLINHLYGLRGNKQVDEAMLAKLGLRLIVPQRPGVGLSTPQRNVTLESWAGDVIELIDHLELSQVGVIGVSAGGPFGMAIAAFHPSRVRHLGLVATVVPIDELPDVPQSNLPRKLLTSMARHWPSGAKTLLKIRMKAMYEAPEAAIRDLSERGSPADRELLKDRSVLNICVRNLKEVGEIPRDVLAEEAIMLARPWGFDVSGLNVPTRLWHGQQDHYGASEEITALANLIPHAELELREDWGHYFFYLEWKNLLQEFSKLLAASIEDD